MSKTVTLPKGTLVWPKINEPDEFKGKKRFKCNIKFSDEDHVKVDAWLKKTAKELGEPKAKLPWKTDKKTGEVTLFVQSGDKYPPGLLDAAGKEVPRSKVQVGGGTVAKVGVVPKAYDVQGGVLTLYMSFIQIIELKVKQKYSVEAEAGFTYSGDDDDDDAVDFDKSTSNDMDDDIPF
jgi:hypothetical protein